MDDGASVTAIRDFLAIDGDDPSAVIDAGRELLPELDSQERKSERAEVTYRMGLARIIHGEYESAFRALSEARHLHEKLDMEENSLQDQLGIGVIYGMSEQPEAAFETFLMVRDRARDGDYPVVEEAADIRMGRICFDQGRYEEGLGFIDAALRLVGATGNRSHEADALKERGRIRLHQGHLEAAALDLEDAREICIELNGREGFDLLISLGDLYTRDGRYDKAREALDDAYDHCRNRTVPHGEAMALFHLGNLLEITEGSMAAVEYWTRCYEKTDSTVLRHLKIKSGEKLVDHYRRAGETDQALAFLEDIRRIEGILRDERLHHTISVYDQSMRIDDLEQEMRSWRRRSGELEKIRSDREEAIRELKTITLIGEKITASLDPDKIVQLLYDSLSQLVTIDGLLIAFFDESNADLDIRYIIENGSYLEPVRIPVRPERSLTSWVVHNDADLIINSREEALRYTKAIHHLDGTAYKSESFLLVRLRIEGRIIGVISVQAVQKNRYRASHLQVLQALASFIAIAMTNSSAHQSLVAANEKIAHMATHDPLTGLPNRAHILTRLGNELDRCRRYESSLAVLFIDLDGFKEINDSYGHRAGDEMLIAIAGRLRTGIRATDATGRLAGDEFLVILTDDCTAEKGILLAEQIRKNLSERVDFEGNSLKVTASIGLAVYPDDAGDAGDLVNAADQAMYRAKASGKDRTESAEQLLMKRRRGDKKNREDSIWHEQ